MQQRVGVLLAAVVLLGVTLACKNSKQEAPTAATLSAPPAASTVPPAPTLTAVATQLTRYGAEEKEAGGKARVAVDELAVYAAADKSGSPLTKLGKDVLVERTARYLDFTLLKYEDPAQPNEPRFGWVEDKQDPRSPVLKDIALPVATTKKATPPVTTTVPTTGRGTRSRPPGMR